MMAMTTSSSIRVKPEVRRWCGFISGFPDRRPAAMADHRKTRHAQRSRGGRLDLLKKTLSGALRTGHQPFTQAHGAAIT